MRGSGLALAVGLFFGGQALALPRMSLTSGAPCSSCHLAPNGGGVRTELGFDAMDRVGLLSEAPFGIPPLRDAGSGLGPVTVGMDARLLLARLGRPRLARRADGTDEQAIPDLRLVPMQAQPYLAVRLIDGVTVDGAYNLSNARDLQQGRVCRAVLPGQSCFEAALTLRPDPSLPTLRAGRLLPSIGIRHDDHTLLIRGDASDRRRPLVPPNYAENGAELSYHPMPWLQVEAGAFGSGQLEAILNEPAQTADLWPVALLGRVSLLPQPELGGSRDSDDLDDFDGVSVGPWLLNTWIGASLYASGDYRLLSAYLGLGSQHGATLMAEVARSTRGADHETLNGLLSTTWALWEGLVLAARVERAQTDRRGPEGAQRDTILAYTAGLELFPVPFVELRPEYRLVETGEYRFGQATVQLHLFY